MYTILRDGEHLYVYRRPTRLECNYYIRNGYTPPRLVREPSPQGYQYARAENKPNYPMPALVTVQIDGTYCSYATWYDNTDEFWTNFVSSRGI